MYCKSTPADREHRIVCTIGIVYVSENIFNIEENPYSFTKEVTMDLLSTLLEICTVHCKPTVGLILLIVSLNCKS